MCRSPKKLFEDLTGKTRKKAAAKAKKSAEKVEERQRVLAKQSAAAAARDKFQRETTGLVESRDGQSTASRTSRSTRRRRRGNRATTATSSLGDSSFGSSIRNATKLGGTA